MLHDQIIGTVLNKADIDVLNRTISIAATTITTAITIARDMSTDR